MCTRCRNHTVEEYLHKEECSCVGAYVIGVVDKIASHHYMGAVRLLFCANRANKFDVGDIFEAIIRDVGFGDSFDGVGTFYPSVHTLCKASKFIGSGSVPGILEFGVTEELSVFKGFAGLHVNNGVCTVVASGKDTCGNAVIGRVPL